MSIRDFMRVREAHPPLVPWSGLVAGEIEDGARHSTHSEIRTEIYEAPESRSSRFRILPVAPFGNDSRNSITRGYL